MDRFGLQDCRDDSSVETEHSAGSSRMNRANLVRLPSMYSPESKASSHESSPIDGASGDDASNATSTTSKEIEGLSNEIKELFKEIDSYEPVELELETPLKCFMPSYIPSVGDVDPCIKIPRPDGVDDGIGTVILDEPIPSRQSNAAVIELQLRNHSKMKSSRAFTVRSICNAAENANEIDEWIQSVEEICSTKSRGQWPVRYQNKMPSTQELMQSWPKEINDELKNGTLELPSADIDLSVEEYARLMCSLLDIPVFEGRMVESVHVMLSLFVEFQESNKMYA